MKKFENINEVKREAIECRNGMLVSWPIYSKFEHLNLSYIKPELDKNFDMNNGTVAFVDNGALYVIPSMGNLISVLNEAGFEKSGMYVPFSNGNFPVQYKDKWKHLLYEQDQSRKDEFEEDCKRYCKENGISEISEDLLKQCLQVPETGMETSHFYGDSWTYPILRTTFFDCTCSEYIGKYDTNNGKCVFVNVNGKTFVTPNIQLTDALQKAGFTRGSLFVPLSNGEVLKDPSLRARWAAIQC